MFLYIDREMVVTSSGLDTGDPLVLSEFLYHEMVAMGQSDQYHGLLQLLLLMPPGAPKLWEFLLKGVRRLIACCISDEEEMDDAFKIDMNKLVIMLESKAEELGGIYPQVSQLAMSVINKESELRQMKSDVDHSMNLLERVRSEMAEALQSVEEELARNGQLDGFLRQLIEPIIDIPERLLANGGLEDDDAMASRVRRRSSVSDMRYEVYTRLLKSLPEANIVRDRMLQDGFSDAEIADYFGTEADKIDPKRKSRSNSGSSLSKIFGAFTGMGGQEKSNSFSSSPPPLKDDKFKRLIKLLPPPLAREKMIEAGYLDKDIEEVVGPNDLSASVPVKATAPATAKPIDPKYEKYYKMMKILPEVAVRQKMGNEGFKEVEIDEFFQQLVDVAVATASGVSISAAPANAAPSVDPKFEKYVKMVKMLPEGAVRQKMAVEGLSPADIELFFTTVLPGLQNKPSTAPAPTAEVSKVATPAAADPKFEKYTKMLKMLPEGPVRQKMANDGISESDINAFFGGSSGGPAKPAGAAAAGGLLGGIKKPASTVELPPAGMKEKQNVAPTKKMKGLFWTKLKNTDVPGTLWSEVEEFQFPAESRELIDTLFSAVGKSAAVEGGDKEEAASKVKKEKNSGVVLFDGKRTQSVMIFLGRVRKLPREVAKMIILLEAKTMTLTMTETLLNVCPTADGTSLLSNILLYMITILCYTITLVLIYSLINTHTYVYIIELNLVKGYDQPHKLDVTGQLFHEFSRIPRLENRLKMYEITLKWDADATEAAQQVSTFLKACIELRRTKPLLGKLFGMVLSLGNYLNGGTARGQAYGVKLDFMAKLGTVKINPISKTANGPAVLCGPTVLHFLAIQAEKSAPEVINLAQAWESVWLAVEIPFQQVKHYSKITLTFLYFFSCFHYIIHM